MFENHLGIDYRNVINRRRLKEINYVIPIVSGKGGVGKSMIATTMAILMAKEGKSVGLLDADLYSSSSSFILGVESQPKEGAYGLIPPISNGVKVMSISLFTGEKPAPLGGKASREVIKEMFAITDWGMLDYLIIDTPPGTGDIMMIIMETIGSKAKPIIVTTPSKSSILTVKKVIELLSPLKSSIIGIIENMCTSDKPDDDVELISREFGVKLVGKIPVDMEAAEAINRGNPSMLTQTNFANSILDTIRKIGLI